MRRASGTNGGEFCGPCYRCAGDGQAGGGRDRFRVWPNALNRGCAVPGRWWCRVCGRRGGTVEILTDMRAITTRDACELLGLPVDTASAWPYHDDRGPARQWSPKPAVIPPPAWRAAATQLAREAQDLLLHSVPGEALVRWLKECRFINRATVERAGLGLVMTDAFFDLEAWGLPPEVNPETGRPRKVWMPGGLLIPVWRQDEVVFLQVRRFEDTENRYVTARGSGGGIMWLGPKDAEIVVLVESRLDALVVFEHLGVTAVALGSAQTRPDLETHDQLALVSKLLLVLDSDTSGGREAETFWAPRYANALRLVLPEGKGKDPCEAVAAGLDIVGWIIDELKKAGREVPAAIVEHQRTYQRPNIVEGTMAGANQGVLDMLKASRPTKTRMSAQDSASASAVVMELWLGILMSGVSHPHDGFGDSCFDWNFWHRRQAEDILHALYMDHCVRAGATPLNPERFIAALQQYLPPMAEGFQPFPKRSDQSNQLLTVRTFVARPNIKTETKGQIRPYKGAKKHFEGVNAFILPGIVECRQCFRKVTGTPVEWPDIVDHERSWFELCQERFGNHASVAAYWSWKLRSARSAAFDSFWRRRVRTDYLINSYHDYCARHEFKALEDEDEFWNAFGRLLPQGRPPTLMLWEKQRCGEGKDNFEWCRVSGLLLPDVNFCRTHFAEITGIDERTFGEPEMSEEIDGNPRSVDRFWHSRLCRGITAPDELDMWQTELYWNRLPASYLLYCGYLDFCRDERCRAVRIKFFLERLFGLLPTCDTITLNLYRKNSGRWTIVDRAESLILDEWAACAERFEHETGTAIHSRGPVTPTPTHSLAQMTVDKLLNHWWGSLLGRDQGPAGQWGEREAVMSRLLKGPENGADYVAVLESCSIFPSMPRILLERRFRNFLRRHGLVFDAEPALTAAWDGMFSALSESVTLVREADFLSAQSCSASPEDVDPDWLDFGQGPCLKQPTSGPGGSGEWYEFKSLEECRKNFELAILGRSLEWPST